MDKIFMEVLPESWEEAGAFRHIMAALEVRGSRLAKKMSGGLMTKRDLTLVQKIMNDCREGGFSTEGEAQSVAKLLDAARSLFDVTITVDWDDSDEHRPFRVKRDNRVLQRFRREREAYRAATELALQRPQPA